MSEYKVIDLVFLFYFVVFFTRIYVLLAYHVIQFSSILLSLIYFKCLFGLENFDLCIISIWNIFNCVWEKF